MKNIEYKFDEYRRWLTTCECIDCGAKYAERTRDINGVCIDAWATETLCMSCFEKQCDPRRSGKYVAEYSL